MEYPKIQKQELIKSNQIFNELENNSLPNTLIESFNSYNPFLSENSFKLNLNTKNVKEFIPKKDRVVNAINMDQSQDISNQFQSRSYYNEDNQTKEIYKDQNQFLLPNTNLYNYQNYFPTQQINKSEQNIFQIEEPDFQKQQSVEQKPLEILAPETFEYIVQNYQPLLYINQINKGITLRVKKEECPRFFIIKSFTEEDIHKVVA